MKTAHICLAAALTLATLFGDGNGQIRKPPRMISAEGKPVVEIFVFPGVQVIDFTGPFEVLSQGGFNVVTVAETPEPISTATGLQVIPNYSFETAPKPDVIVVPGGFISADVKNNRVLDWLRKSAGEAKNVMSVCNGAFYLSAAGLLDGQQATTFHTMIDELAKETPKAKVVRDQRWTDNGKIITTAGLSSGIDGSFHLIAKWYGVGRARVSALNLEYAWDPSGNGFVRAALADMPIIHVLGMRGFPVDEMVTNWQNADLISDKKHALKTWTFRSKAELSALWPKFESTLSSGWTRSGGDAGATSAKSTWSGNDDGQAFDAVAKLMKSGEAYTLSLEITRR